MFKRKKTAEPFEEEAARGKKGVRQGKPETDNPLKHLHRGAGSGL